LLCDFLNGVTLIVMRFEFDVAHLAFLRCQQCQRKNALTLYIRVLGVIR
jgi:hypothetical protein